MVAQGGQHTAVQVAERRLQFVAHLELGAQDPWPDLGVTDAEKAHETAGGIGRALETGRGLGVVLRELEIHGVPASAASSGRSVDGAPARP